MIIENVSKKIMLTLSGRILPIVSWSFRVIYCVQLAPKWSIQKDLLYILSSIVKTMGKMLFDDVSILFFNTLSFIIALTNKHFSNRIKSLVHFFFRSVSNNISEEEVFLRVAITALNGGVYAQWGCFCNSLEWDRFANIMNHHLW